MNEFDLKAATWDQNPIIWERAGAIANEIKRIIPLKKEMTALEFGAGTGVTSFILKDSLKEIVLMDNSTEMVKIMNDKIKTSGVKNLKALNFNLEESDFKEGKFDLIFNQMVLHHIADIENIITKFFNLLSPGGYLAIADLYTEDGSFHGKGFTGHKGFDPEKLSAILLKSGFRKTSHHQCFVINKKISDFETKQFAVFLITSQHP
jgi:tRNA (cmo5U34)-methyltransferase